MGQDFCCIDIFIFQIADKRPDFNPLVMTVIYIIQACQVGNVSIVVIQPLFAMYSVSDGATALCMPTIRESPTKI